MGKTKIVKNENSITEKIILIRDRKVLLDSDLAELYNVETRRLNEQVKRNRGRFPDDFMFQLNREEWEILKSQFATSKWGGRRTLPYVFTEHGAIMLASVLNSERAVETSVLIVRAFVKMRNILEEHKDLTRKLRDLEKKYDDQFKIVFDTIRRLINPPEPKKRRIGFGVDNEN